MKNETTTTENKKNLSFDEAVELINRRTYSILYKFDSKTQGDYVFFRFDEATVEGGEHMELGRNNSYDKIFIPLAEITNIVHNTYDYNKVGFIQILLSNGGEWTVCLCGGEDNYQLQTKNYEEVEIEQFLERLCNCSQVYVSYSQEQLSLNAYYDTVNIDYTNDNLASDGERKVHITLADSNRRISNFTICFDEYGENTRCYIVHKGGNLEIYNISLYNMPLLSKLSFILFN